MYEIHALPFGQQGFPGSLCFQFAHFGEWFDLTYYCWLLKSPERVVLVDVGMSQAHAERRNPTTIGLMGPRAAVKIWREVPDLLRDHGLGVDDIETVILTHLHYDHVLNAQLFRKSRFVVSRRGLANVVAPRHRAMISPHRYPREVLAYLVGEASDRLVLAEEREEVLPGIEVIWVGGHSPCSQAIRIATAQGPVTLAGDVAYFFANLEQMHPIGLHTSLVECYDALALLTREGGTVIPNHDLKLLERYPDRVIARG